MKVIEFPEQPVKGDVSNYLKAATGLLGGAVHHWKRQQRLNYVRTQGLAIAQVNFQLISW